MTQLICHLFGDYVFQSDWMAREKTKHWWPCLCHAALYSAGFLFLRPSWKALAVIAVTHYFIDRYRLARYVAWAKNWMGAVRPVYVNNAGDNLSFTDTGKRARSWEASNLPFAACSATGYPPEVPPWMAVWLMIACDNTMHLFINYLALRFLP